MRPITTRAPARCVALQEALDLPEAPLRIECFDISHIQGTEIVASMVVMEDGIAKRSDYRRFKVKTLDNQDDFASMEEVLTRRFRNYLRERDEGAHAGKRFSYPPNLLVVDGGKGQLNVAVRVLEELGLEDICVASLAKKLEEVYLPGRSEPVRIPRDSEALYLLQQVRDEAHRFAITYHRQLRGQEDDRLGPSTASPVSGPAASSGSCKEVGSVKKLRELTEEDLLALAWLPDAVGTAVYERLHGLDDARSPRAGAPQRDDGRDMNAPTATDTPLDVTIITGMSGAGRSEAAHVLEDLGFFVIDNLPPMLIGKVAELARGQRHADALRARRRRALGRLPARPLGRDRRAAPPGRHHPRALPRRRRRRARAPLRGEPAPAPALRQRTRQRRHRARARAARAARGRGRPARRHVDPQRARAARPVARALLRARVGDATLQVNVVSFGYKHGLPLDVDLVFDCRFLPNPHWVDELRPLTGLDAPVRDYVLAQRGTREFLDELDRLFGLLLPGYEREGKAYLSIAFGCTGGRHRSVVIAEQLAERLRRHGHRTAVHHRDVERAV